MIFKVKAVKAEKVDFNLHSWKFILRRTNQLNLLPLPVVHMALHQLHYHVLFES